MFSNPKKWILAGLVAVAPLQAMASISITSTGDFDNIQVGGTTYSRSSGYNSEPSNNFNQFQVTATDGTVINVSGWSDTAGSNGTGNNKDPYIERAKDLDRNKDGWSMENVDEGNGCGYSHSADNYDDGGTCDWVDYDFFLLDFGTAVTLDSAMFSWRSGTTAQNQVSIVALDDTKLSNNLNGETFQTVKNDSLGYAGSQMQNGGINGVGSYYADSNVNQSSSLWIISAYNTMFGTVSGGSNYNDGFKLAGVSFSRPSTVTVPEPSTIAMLSLALFGLSMSKRKKR